MLNVIKCVEVVKNYVREEMTRGNYIKSNGGKLE